MSAVVCNWSCELVLAATGGRVFHSHGPRGVRGCPCCVAPQRLPLQPQRLQPQRLPLQHPPPHKCSRGTRSSGHCPM